MAGQEMEEYLLLKRRVEKVLDRFSLMKEEIQKVNEENDGLRELLENKEVKLEEFNKENDRIKLSGAIMGDDDKTQIARKRINVLVREIDNCIALLNNI